MAEKLKNKRAARRDRIVEQAAEVFARYGYDKTTLDDIGKQCGLNKASLYYYFKNKEELFLQVVLTGAQRFAAQLQAEVAEIVDPEAKIIHYILARVRRYQEVLALNQLSADALAHLEGQYLARYQGTKIAEVEFLAGILADAHAQGRLFVPDAPATAESIFLISDALKHGNRTQELVYFDGRFDFSQLETKLRHILQLIFRGLRTPPQTPHT